MNIQRPLPAMPEHDGERDWGFDPGAHLEMGNDPNFIAGMLEHSCRMAIRDLVRLEGFEKAREHVAGFLNDEADRGKRHA